MVNQKQEHTIGQIRGIYQVHTVWKGIVTVSFGSRGNKVGVEIDKDGTIISATVVKG